MKIGIVAAMELELLPLMEHFLTVKSFEYAGKTFWISSKNTHQLIFLCSGQGKTNSAMYTQLLIEKFSPDIVLNIGICGGITSSCSQSDLYLGEKYCHYDIRKKQSLSKFPNRLFFPADEHLIACFSAIDPSVKRGIFGTGEGFVASDHQKKRLIDDFKIDCVDMESAAVAQCCYLNDVRFLSIRVVADDGGPNAAKNSEAEQAGLMAKPVDLVCSFISSFR